MLERVGSGEHLIAYNVFGSYALARAKKDPSIGWLLPEDYTLVTSRVALISGKASLHLATLTSRELDVVRAIATRDPGESGSALRDPQRRLR